jgi:hypothetical protein
MELGGIDISRCLKLKPKLQFQGSSLIYKQNNSSIPNTVKEFTDMAGIEIDPPFQLQADPEPGIEYPDTETSEELKSPQETSAYREEGCDTWTISRMAREAQEESKYRGHTKLDLRLFNQSDTEICVFSNGDFKTCKPNECLVVTGTGVDILLHKCAENKEAKAKHGYSFGADFLRSLIEIYSEYDHVFCHPRNQDTFYNLNFKNTTSELSVVTITLASSGRKQKMVRRGEKQAPQAPKEKGDGEHKSQAQKVVPVSGAMEVHD